MVRWAETEARFWEIIWEREWREDFVFLHDLRSVSISERFLVLGKKLSVLKNEVVVEVLDQVFPPTGVLSRVLKKQTGV